MKDSVVFNIFAKSEAEAVGRAMHLFDYNIGQFVTGYRLNPQVESVLPLTDGSFEVTLSYSPCN